MDRKGIRFLVAEFLVIVVGVLVALGVDQVIAERQDRAAEAEYATRLEAELASDTATFAWFDQTLDRKAAILTAVLDGRLEEAVLGEPVSGMESITYSTFIGLPPIDEATFGELRSTGSLRLIQYPELRGALTNHYEVYARMTVILDNRFGPYREIVFGALPGRLQMESRLDVKAVDLEALRRGLAKIQQHPDLIEAANAEMAYTASLRFYMHEADARARSLLDSLAERYPN